MIEAMGFPTLMLLVQWVGLPEPHQTAEQQQRPEDLNKETHLDKEGFSPTQQKTRPTNDSFLTRIPSASSAESSSSTVKGGLGNLSSWLRGVTPGRGHETVTNLPEEYQER